MHAYFLCPLSSEGLTSKETSSHHAFNLPPWCSEKKVCSTYVSQPCIPNLYIGGFLHFRGRANFEMNGMFKEAKITFFSMHKRVLLFMRIYKATRKMYDKFVCYYRCRRHLWCVGQFPKYFWNKYPVSFPACAQR